MNLSKRTMDLSRAAVMVSGFLTAIVVASLALAESAAADTTINGPVDLGSAANFAVLAGSTVTNTGTSVIGSGDVGLSPGSSITGFPPGIITPPGVQHVSDTQATNGQADLTTAYGVAASLTPMTSGLSDLSGLSLVPGVYSGTTLSLTGQLTLTGSASSVWVFQSAQTLVTGAASSVLVTGGASACNVFWQVGSSATLGTSSTFVGTILANDSITATTTADITGRLLARTGAVTLDTNTLTSPSGCTTPPGTVTTTPASPSATPSGTSPTITSPAPTRAARGVPYTYRLTAAGSPGTTFAITSGGLAPGLVLDSTTGVISGTPTQLGTYAMTVKADNGISPPATASYRLAVLDTLALTGVTPLPALATGGGALAVGMLLVFWSMRSRRRRGAHRA